MRILLVLIAACSVSAWAQRPQELLQLAENAYLDSSGYEIKGRASVQPAGSSWEIHFDVRVGAAPAPHETPDAPRNPAIRTGGPPEFQKVGGGNDSKPASSISIFDAVVGGWSRIAEKAESVAEIGTEKLPLNGTPVSCRVLLVQYEAAPEGPKPAPVEYSICSDKHLVLKKVMSYSTGRRPTDPAGRWTITFDTAEFHRPAPSWVRELSNQPKFRVRNEWRGKPAPAFKLTDLDGNSVELSSMRGKVVLLDFWSTACAPCIREMPSITNAAEAHTGDLVLWGVSADQPDRDRKWFAHHQQRFPTLSDMDYVVSDLYKVQGIPATVVIGRKGKIMNYWQGEVPAGDLQAALTRACRGR